MVVQAKATPKRRSRLTVEKLLDRAEGFMQMSGLSATAAVTKAMPDDLLAISLEDLRGLAESALVAKLAQRRSRERYRETERRGLQVQRLTEQVMGQINARIQKKAEVLARVTYVMHGVPTPLLTMSLEDHLAKKVENQRTSASATARFKFHDSVIKLLKEADVGRIADLSTSKIEELAEAAEQVWGT